MDQITIYCLQIIGLMTVNYFVGVIVGYKWGRRVERMEGDENNGC